MDLLPTVTVHVPSHSSLLFLFPPRPFLNTIGGNSSAFDQLYSRCNMNKILSLTIAVLVAALGLLIATTLMTIDSKMVQRDIKIISEHPTVEELLTVHKDVIGNDYDAYRGHIYRVLTYSIHILGTKGPIDIIAAALVYHDIGLWTDKMLNYIGMIMDSFLLLYSFL